MLPFLGISWGLLLDFLFGAKNCYFNYCEAHNPIMPIMKFVTSKPADLGGSYLLSKTNAKTYPTTCVTPQDNSTNEVELGVLLLL